MGLKPEFKKKILASSISSACLFLTMGAVAQDQAGIEEEVIVTGIKASQASAINTKRDAVSVVDGIAAEDIGKLPDVTISDSLQRIPGIQVNRTAGESGGVQIRGLGNVGTMLNGEQFLSATTIDQAAADFGDLPSQLFAGASVYKSPISTLPSLGISGAVDLKTRRPFDLDEGFTVSGGVEVDRGSISDETDPTINLLGSWQNEKIGILAAVVTAEKTLATDFNGYFDTSENGGIGAANNNHLSWDSADTVNNDIYHIVPQGFAAFHKEEERQRDGANLSFQWDIGQGFELTADYFYSKQERWNRRAGVSQNNRWQGFNNYARPSNWGANDFTVQVDDGEVQNWRTVTAYNAEPWRLQSFAQTNKNTEVSQNSNIELNYDNDGALTGQVRITRASATAKMRHGYTEGDLLSIDSGSVVTGPGGLLPAQYCDESRGDIIVGDNGGCFAAYSANGIEDSDFVIGYDSSPEHPHFTGFDQTVTGGKGPRTVAEYMADIDSYHVGAFSSEGNTDDKASMDTFSTRWNYEFEDTPFISSIDFGLRQSEREIEHRQFSYFNDFPYTGCSAQWKAVDQFAGSNECLPYELQEQLANGDIPEITQAMIDEYQGEYVTGVDQEGTAYNNEFVNYTLLQPMRIDQANNVIWIDDFGGVTGLPGVWVADPKDFDDTFAFQERTFGAGTTKKVSDPGQSYDVTLSEFSYYLQGNFEMGPVSGNLGMKVVETDLKIRQNEVGAGIPHSGASVDTGDVVTTREYIDYLPSLNLSYTITEDLTARFAWGKTMQPINLLDWGGGKSVGRVFNDDCQCMRVANGSFAGNPALNPTRAENLDLSFEYYLGDATMFSIGYYNIDVESFVQPGSVWVDEPDDDGVNRGPFLFTSPVQGTGGEVSGWEVGAKLAFSDLLDAPVISDMGLDLNYTYSDSSQEAIGDGAILVNGSQKELPFINNSKDTYNFVVWYENSLVSARVAYNFRSERLMTEGNPATGYQGLYEDDYGQLDMNVTVNVTDQVSVYLNGLNVTEEYQQAYLEYKDQKAFQNIYEARWSLGARFTF
ncbi:TonB-dependent receptor [Teredinibacter sp. KSP-S5-2]|uniref:TonB-dependent receptor n=1 Tax=Teredinibacter sp. KSP-S5-2 TaxID=3034506 RepID=UPI00293532EE|nr:TonB-dependent receptor [Teredinibacter sp. KSP-S5-2]WNO07698.1 TonB-dependent receptor [Teredinibacter sp. KSP-S5-2]